MEVDVTIVVPMYNVERYLPDFFLGLAHQSYQGFRLIVVDDCSTDNTFEIAAYLAEPFGDRARVLRNRQNSGQSATRNVGLDEACKKRTKYITFLDADDWFESAYLEDLYKAAEENDADIAISGIVRFDDETDAVICKEMVSYSTKLFEDSSTCDDLAAINTCPYAKLFLFEPIIDLRFRTAKRSEDTCYLFEALPRLKRIVFTNHALYHYRVRRGSITGAMGKEAIDSMHELFSAVYPRFQTDEGEPYRELFESQVYIRSSVGGVTRVAFTDLGKSWVLSREELAWLDLVIPAWRKNKYLSFGRWRSKAPKQVALKISASLYKAHAFPFFIYLYYIVSVVLKKEVRA